MRRITSYGPSIVVALAAVVFLAFGPAAVKRLQAARTAALVQLAQDRLAASSVLEQINQAKRDIAQAVGPSVVYIDAVIRDPRGRFGNSNGSGWVYDSDGHIVTNAHVVDGAGQISVQFYDGRIRGATLVGIDRSTDIAVVKVGADSSLLVPARRIPNSTPIHQGDQVFAFGSPFQFKFSMSEGIVSGLGRSARTNSASTYSNYIQTDAAINPGNSGGPLSDIYGRIIGMNTAIITSRQRDQVTVNTGVSGGIGFAIPMDTIESVVDQVIGQGYVLKGFLGVSLGDLNVQVAEQNGFDQGLGTVITSVTDESAAARAGIRNNDILVAVNGERTPSVDVTRSLIGNREPGEVIELTVWRNGRTVDVDVELGAALVNAAGNLVPVDPDRIAASVEQERFEGIVVSLARFGITNLDDTEDGLMIAGVRGGSAASELGFRRDQLIVRVDGQRVEDREQFFSMLETLMDRPDAHVIPLLIEDQGGDRFELNVLLTQ
ncbi:MAG: trypsin-like peptidase domain-containing protein [Phycisphaerales bacterium JB043]